jgi:endonuclease G, mitochondrial
MTNKRIRALLVLLSLTVGVTACSTTSEHTRAAVGSVHIAMHAGLTPEQKAMADANCFKGLPQKTAENLGPTELIFRQGYVLEHSSVDKIPLWVCEGVEKQQLAGSLVRDDKFKTDPDLKGPKSAPGDYTGTGYDRGHQAPAGNQTMNADLKLQTFYMSNMAPQLPTLNRQIWRMLEEKTRDWAKEYGHAYEWTGPVFYDPKEDTAVTADGTVSYKTIGKDSVAVPTHFYKIVVVQDGTAWKSIAFVLPNVNYTPPYHLEQYITSIDWIEQHTGINFMPDLDAQERSSLETHSSTMWQ